MMIKVRLDEQEKTNRAKFTPDDDRTLQMLVQDFKSKNKPSCRVHWKEISQKMGNKTPKQCRDRYMSYLKPGITNQKWTKEEDLLLVQKMLTFGKRWTLISSFFPGRGMNNVKNRWYKCLVKKFQSVDKIDLSNYIDTSANEIDVVITEDLNIDKPTETIDETALMELYY